MTGHTLYHIYIFMTSCCCCCCCCCVFLFFIYLFNLLKVKRVTFYQMYKGIDMDMIFISITCIPWTPSCTRSLYINLFWETSRGLSYAKHFYFVIRETFFFSSLKYNLSFIIVLKLLWFFTCYLFVPFC